MTRFIKHIFFVVSVLAAGVAHATLGQSVSSVGASVTQMSNYTVQTITQNNTVIKQYYNGDGTVFAVSWSGQFKPDLASLLDSYFSQVQAAGTNNLNQLQINNADIVLNMAGRMRNFYGSANIPALTPSGFQFQ